MKTFKKGGAKDINGTSFAGYLQTDYEHMFALFSFPNDGTRDDEWRSISPIEQPSILVRVFYSALDFVVPGYLLYIAGFYKFLHNVIVRGLRDWQLYRGIKAVIWVGLMFLMYEVFGIIVSIMNVVLSFFYNIFKLVLYISPGIGVFLILTVVNTTQKQRRVLPLKNGEKTVDTPQFKNG